MKQFWSVFKREFVAYFSTPLAYVFLVIFIFFSSFLTWQNNFFEVGQASMRIFFGNMPLLLTFLVPAVAMRLWAEERRSNSVELLMTLPVTLTQAVLAKFAAAWAVVAVVLVLTFPMLLTVSYLGDPDPGPIVTGYLGSFLMAGAYMAIGGFFSALTRNQVIAFVLAVVACAVFVYAGNPMALNYYATVLPPNWVEAVESLSFLTRFESLQRGVIELRDVVFFVVLGAGWLWATTVVLKERIAAG